MSRPRQRHPVFWTLAFGVLLGATACAQAVLEPPTPAPPALNWVVHDVPGTPFAISTPPDFAPTGEPGCFRGEATDTLRFGPGWRDFCLWVHRLEDPIPVFVDSGAEPGCLECVSYDDVSTTPMTLGQWNVLVQTALVSGGVDEKARAPEMLIQIPIPQGLALLQAEYGDARDAAVILGIARTMSGG